MDPLREPRDGRIDYLVGACVALPMVFPVRPLVPFAILGFLVAIVRSRPDALQWLGWLVLTATGFLGTIFSPLAAQVDLGRALYAPIAAAFFMAGGGIADRRRFVVGYADVMGATALLVILAFLTQGVWRMGLALFYTGAGREWGEGLIPAWPNYAAFFLGVAMLLEAFWLRRWVRLLPFGIAILLTTSRTGLLGLAWVAMGLSLKGIADTRSRRWFVLGAAVLGALILYFLWPTIAVLVEDPLLVKRLVKTEDRVVIYEWAWGWIAQRPFLGLGFISLGDLSGAPASGFHNTYLEVIARHGIIGLIGWLLLVWPRRGWNDAPGGSGILILTYFLGAALFNDILRNPNAVLLYSCLFLGGAGIRSRVP